MGENTRGAFARCTGGVGMRRHHQRVDSVNVHPKHPMLWAGDTVRRRGGAAHGGVRSPALAAVPSRGHCGCFSATFRVFPTPMCAKAWCADGAGQCGPFRRL